jgi:hypothetical protein
MNITQRVQNLLKVKEYLLANTNEWQQVKQEASYKNSWFTPQFIHISVDNIITHFLDKEKLLQWLGNYNVKENSNKTIGLVMAGNIPLVGFHDFLCCFLSGHNLLIKASSRDEVLIKHIVEKMIEFDEAIKSKVTFAEMLKNCDAYIATGSNNSSRYFNLYFSKFPNMIRRNRTSVAVLEGNETFEDLQLLAQDIQLYFGQGCRNVTHLFVPKNYNFELLINALKKFDYFLDLHKYKHNYDYQLAMLMMNSKMYMTDGSVLLAENDSVFSAISCVHYSYYEEEAALLKKLNENNDIQCIVGKKYIPFGQAQSPSLYQYADGIDTMNFLCNL